MQRKVIAFMSQMPAYSPPASDEAVAIAAQAGDTDAFAELVRRYQSPLQGFLCGRLGLGGQSEDLVQDVFLRMFEYLPHYNSRQRFRAWLFTIAYRLGVSSLRRRRLELRYLRSAANQPDAGEAQSHPAAVAEEQTNLWDHARRILPDRQLALLWLFYVDELTVKEAAHALGMTVISAKVGLHRARKKIAHAVTPANHDAHGPGGDLSLAHARPDTNGCAMQSSFLPVNRGSAAFAGPYGAAVKAASPLPEIKFAGERG